MKVVTALSRMAAAQTPVLLTENELGWVQFIRLASRDADPKPTLVRIQQLQRMLRDTG